MEAFQKRRKRRAGNVAQDNGHITLTQIANPDFLYECLDHLRCHGGSGAGLDGITYADLSPSEWGDILQKLSRSVLAGRYRPQKTKKTPIPKPGSSEKRILSIGSTCDRILAHAFDFLVKPHADKQFLPGSWGFRPQRGVWQMFADLKQTVETTGRWVLAIDDVRKAFDNVPIDRLMASMQNLRQDLKDRNDGVTINESVVELLAVMARGTAQTRTIGIDQGNNSSPLALNVLLHYVHDQPLTAVVGFPFWYRYADNLVYVCRSVSKGRKLLNQAGELLRQSGLTLKGRDGVTDLRKNPVQLLGFQLREQKGQLRFLVAEETWKCLEEHLREAHRAKDPLQIADEVMTGWINAFGPAFEKGKPIVTRVCELANQFGFREISRERIEKLVTGARERWEKMLQQVTV